MHFVGLNLISVHIRDSYSQPAFGVMFVMTMFIQKFEVAPAYFIKNS